MLSFRLKVFITVAKRLSFTKAAAELFISQPAVTRHIRELEYEFKVSFFERSGNKKISLTPAGVTLQTYVEKLLTVYRELEYDMNLLSHQEKGTLRIGASSTVAQYVIPPILAEFHDRFKDIQVQLTIGNTEEIEQGLIRKEMEIGIIEGISRNPQIKYEHYLQDELVLVCSGKNFDIKKDVIKIEELKNYPLLMREPGSGTLEVVAHALRHFGLKMSDLHIEMQLGGTESIKSYLVHSKCMAFLSIYSVLNELKNNEYRIIDIKEIEIKRPFNFIQLHGQPDALAELFMRFAKNFPSER